VTERTAADALVQLKAKGMELHVQTPEEEAKWRAVMQQPVIDAFLKSAPQDGAKILELLKAL
jgi:C4-dicarboxylate-binding protein DctP